MATEVVVVGDDPIGLIVRPLEPGREGERLPNHGQIVYATQQEREDAVEKSDQIASQQDWAARRRGGSLMSAAFGAIAAGLTLCAVRTQPNGVLTASALTIGALWGFSLYRLVYWVVGVFGTAYRNLATISTNLGLVGTAAGFTLGTWVFDVWDGVILGTFLTFVLASAVPAIVIRSSGGTPDV
ncbi:hypothetical protein [Gemmata massiliana]|nr:hypothetical protein [Gemmata massiliana]